MTQRNEDADFLAELTPEERRRFREGTWERRLVYTRTWKSSQSWNRETVLTVHDHKLRVQIKHDAYQAQSYARGHRWDGTQWHQVTWLPPNMMTSWMQKLDAVMPETKFGPAFSKDEQALIDTMLEIIS